MLPEIPASVRFSENPPSAENPEKSFSVTALGFCENPGSGGKSPERILAAAAHF